MTRYIDADELIVFGLDNPDDEHLFEFVPKEFIDNAPTVDAVEVVRCKDCKHLRGSNGHDRPWCGLTKWMPNGITRKLDDYCSYGERREDDDRRSH